MENNTERVVKVPKILLPKKGIDMEKWATIACDQFTSTPEYWERLVAFVGDSPSTLKLTCPEIYLSRDVSGEVKKVQAEMRKYLDEGIFDEREGFVLVERQVGNDYRIGLMAAIDLDAYDWHRVRTPIRATEDTLMERLPVRIAIRKGAEIEAPHAIILMDDREKDIIEPLYAARDGFEKLYDFELNMGGGHIRGWLVPRQREQEILDKIAALNTPELQIEKYGSDAGIMLAVGDGNHSVATAKVCYEELKQSLTGEQQKTCPERYMLVELVNLHGGGMEFSPIHRYFKVRDDEFVAKLKASLYGDGRLKIMYKGGEEYIKCPENAGTAITEIQRLVEAYIKETGAEIDYVHDVIHLKECVDKSDGMGIVMPAFSRSDLFGYVVNVGNLPKKAFSIGEAEQKRYYLECRKIK
ncbi:MAG TPA: DUF1015 domain-containing protein [Candidatus Stercoripulliclostridium merdigallinarum]|uniref:DUF1015 domain-containing protein n=1 Tax=Candidatus Stercoripulliclostridium merdigallinarum TaxID=2840951 RepID=A0A9D1MHE3_9FIRM|nr:DUF1015 domain-containing protein [Candidatus Stercoripulliclostridium merdigallinarum]